MIFPEQKVGLGLILLGFASLVVLNFVPITCQGTAPRVEQAAQQQQVSIASPESPSQRQACKVLSVYDGDTLGCDLNHDGQIERPVEEIRLLGIDSPEMHYSRKNPTYGTEHPTDEPFAPEASHWLESHAYRKTVYLEFDQRRQDKYGRTLAHVFADQVNGQSLNAQLVTAGYARLLFLGRNRLHEAEYRALESEARQAGRGLWGARGTGQQ